MNHEETGAPRDVGEPLCGWASRKRSLARGFVSGQALSSTNPGLTVMVDEWVESLWISEWVNWGMVSGWMDE